MIAPVGTPLLKAMEMGDESVIDGFLCVTQTGKRVELMYALAVMIKIDLGSAEYIALCEKEMPAEFARHERLQDEIAERRIKNELPPVTRHPFRTLKRLYVQQILEGFGVQFDNYYTHGDALCFVKPKRLIDARTLRGLDICVTGNSASGTMVRYVGSSVERSVSHNNLWVTA